MNGLQQMTALAKATGKSGFMDDKPYLQWFDEVCASFNVAKPGSGASNRSQSLGQGAVIAQLQAAGLQQQCTCHF